MPNIKLSTQQAAKLLVIGFGVVVCITLIHATLRQMNAPAEGIQGATEEIRQMRCKQDPDAAGCRQ